MVEKQAFVVMLPLTDDEEDTLLEQIISPEEADMAVRAIGAPVDSSVPAVAHIHTGDLKNFVSEGRRYKLVTVLSKNASCAYTALVRQSDHLAALAEKQAEVERLRISECKMKEAAVHLIRTMRRDDLTKTERIDAAIRQINARLIPELAGAAS